MPLLLVVLVVPVAVALYVASTFIVLLVRQHLSPLRSLPGPPSPSFFLGNLREMHDQENNGLVHRWSSLYGPTFVYRGFLSGCRLMTTDPVAASYILGRAYDFPKPDFVRDGLSDMIGGHEGILVVEGEDHRRQRKVLTPAFSASHIRSLSPIFWQKAVELRSIWLDIISSSHAHPHAPAPPDPLTPSGSTAMHDQPASPTLSRSSTSGQSSSFLPNPFSSFVSSKVAPSPDVNSTGTRRRTRMQEGVLPTSEKDKPDTWSDGRGPRVDVLAWFARATLDVIGEAGFGYTFDSLSGGKESELAQAFGVIFSTARKFRVLTILQVWFPILRKFQRQPTELKEAHETMHRIGLGLIEEKRTEIMSEKSSAFASEGNTDGRDILSVLIRSNLSSDPSQRLSTSETLCQISTFLAAGHETTASALTWSLYALASAPAVQHKLRAELRSISAPSLSSPSSSESSPPSPYPAPSAEDLTEIFTCQYLDAVVREVLRVHSPVTSTMRVAAHDNVIPLSPSLSSPSSPSIKVNKGDIISIPISALNQSVEDWGEDGRVFRPERWLHDHEGQGWERRSRVQGLWGNMLTFLNGNPINGNRACIGWRFAINE
ncbi:cytochrome P450 [Cristinia sonorae]|uniref:Cytochrome P450 n=1 Tax=Cristinia sonorae TaxID=1940300 RepID=A0A8K0UE17_9AGAR|nr:cytochrome P450 [Cristinia sonorae]